MAAALWSEPTGGPYEARPADGSGHPRPSHTTRHFHARAGGLRRPPGTWGRSPRHRARPARRPRARVYSDRRPERRLTDVGPEGYREGFEVTPAVLGARGQAPGPEVGTSWSSSCAGGKAGLSLITRKPGFWPADGGGIPGWCSRARVEVSDSVGSFPPPERAARPGVRLRGQRAERCAAALLGARHPANQGRAADGCPVAQVKERTRCSVAEPEALAPDIEGVGQQETKTGLGMV
jgi:hypothetical protein